MKKKRRFLALFIGIFVLSVMSYFGYKIYRGVEYKKEAEEKRSEISTLRLKTLAGEIFTNEDLEIDKNILFVFFDSGCEICQIEGDSFSKAANEFHSTHIYFVSKESTEQISKFRIEKNLNQTNITFLQDDGNFSSNYDVSSVPFMCLYDKSGKLINIYKGGVKPELILKDAERIH